MGQPTTRVWKKENKFARRVCRRYARHVARALLLRGWDELIPRTDRASGCRTQGWICN